MTYSFCGDSVEQQVDYAETPVFDKQATAPASLELLSHRELEEEIKELNAKLRRVREVKYAKYPSSQKKKKAVCPKLRKGFANKEQIIHFYTTMPNTWRGEINNSKLNLIMQFLYGLRISEVETATYNPYTRLVRVETLKQGQLCIDYIPFIEGTERLFAAKRVSSDSLRNYFNEHCKYLGMPYTEVYYHTGKAGLKRISTQSARVSSANLLKDYTKVESKMRYFLRHSLNRVYGTLSNYLEYPEEEYREDLNNTMRPYVEALLYSSGS